MTEDRLNEMRITLDNAIAALKFHDEMRLTIEAGLGILANVESRLPSEILWKILARDLLARIDRAVPQRVAHPSLDHVRPSNGIERDDADLDWAS